MIVRVLRGQPELRTVIEASGETAPRRLDPEKIRLVITAPPPPKDARISRIVRRGDWGYPPMREDPDFYPDDPDLLPAIVYPAFEATPEGEIAFRLDRLLFDRPCGRHLGRIEIDGRHVATLDIDCHPRRWILGSASAGPAIGDDI